MIKYSFLILILCLSCNSQKKKVKSLSHEKKEIQPPFSNQGEQELYWAQEVFKNEYEQKVYDKFHGEIEIIAENTIGYDTDLLTLYCNPAHKIIFTSGILYPKIFYSNSVGISNLKELDFLSNSPKVKRFVCHFYDNNSGLANPTIYYFELINETATEKTDFRSFLNYAKLTFVKRGSLQI